MNINKVIKDLQIRVEKIEKVVFGTEKGGPKITKQQNFKGATGGIRLLISKGFFDCRRNFGEIREGLASHDYHYSNQAIQTPLNNLSTAGGPLVSFKKDGKKVYAKRK